MACHVSNTVLNIKARVDKIRGTFSQTVQCIIATKRFDALLRLGHIRCATLRRRAAQRIRCKRNSKTVIPAYLYHI